MSRTPNHPPQNDKTGLYEEDMPRPGMREFLYGVRGERCAIRLEFAQSLVTPEVIDQVIATVQQAMAHTIEPPPPLRLIP